ncbi:Mercuric reductase; AltName: Full=Hg(II) reductase [Serendipita indica DSM 11827]|nr:Mercuric reductase; AltName: Full=Hg(II) reductase [Serendipita indica DSM 11827]
MSKHFDYIIIGSGQAGTPLSTAFAKAGKKTALIERAHVGGCCVNEGCTPTKTMIASGRVAYLARRGQDYGVHTPSDGIAAKTLEGNSQNEVSVDMAKVRERKRNIVTDSRTRNENRVKDAGVDLFMGEGSFVDSKTIKVKMGDGKEETITGDVICINTGERPASPNLSGIETVPKERIRDSTSIMELGEVPSHLLVVGGGYIGLEFGQLFRRLGAEVTIIQRGKHLMPREDPDITSALLEIVREDGITVHLEAAAHSASYASGQIHISIKAPTGDLNLSGSHILFASGRVPNVESLNLPAAGIKFDGKKGYILCNDKLETNVPGIYALGDVKGPPAFTHISYDDFRILQTNLITNSSNPSAKPATITDRLVPYVAYTDPQLGHVGLHEYEARTKYPNATIKTAKMPMNYVARALETDESRGLMKAVINADTGMILGFSCLGVEGGEVMAIVQTAMMGNLRWEVLRDAVWAHPSLAESLNNLWGFLE